MQATSTEMPLVLSPAHLPQAFCDLAQSESPLEAMPRVKQAERVGGVSGVLAVSKGGNVAALQFKRFVISYNGRVLNIAIRSKHSSLAQRL